MNVSDKTMRLHDHCMRVCGANLAQRVAGAQQFRQAMAKGRLNGSELDYLREHNPYLFGVIGRYLQRKHAEVIALADAGELGDEAVVVALATHEKLILSDSEAVPISYEELAARRSRHTPSGRLMARLMSDLGAD